MTQVDHVSFVNNSLLPDRPRHRAPSCPPDRRSLSTPHKPGRPGQMVVFRSFNNPYYEYEKDIYYFHSCDDSHNLH